MSSVCACIGIALRSERFRISTPPCEVLAERFANITRANISGKTRSTSEHAQRRIADCDGSSRLERIRNKLYGMWSAVRHHLRVPDSQQAVKQKFEYAI